MGRAAADSGAAAIAAVTPFYYAMDDGELSQFYADLAAACPTASFLPYNTELSCGLRPDHREGLARSLRTQDP